MASADQAAPLSEKPRLQCARCKLESEWTEAFHRVQDSTLASLYYHLCPRCWKRRQDREARQAFWGFLGLGLLSVLMAIELSYLDVRVNGVSEGWFMLNLLLFLFVELALIVPHEAGHAIAAWLLGVRVYGVTIGIG